MSETNPIEAANAQITAPPTTGPADQHSTAATNQTAHTPTTDPATTDSTPIKTTTNVYHTDSDTQKPAESAESTEHTESTKRAEPATASTDKADTTSTSRPDARSSYRPGSKALDLPPPVTSSSRSSMDDSASNFRSSKDDSASNFRSSKDDSASNFRSSKDDSASNFKSTKDVSRSGPPLPVTTSASALPRSSPPLPVTTSASDVLPVCPDPTAHRNTRLQEQASGAALYATKSGKSSRPKEDVLDANNKLSSRSKICKVSIFVNVANHSQVPPLRSSMQMLETSPASLSSVSTQPRPLIPPPTWQTLATSNSNTGSPTRLRMRVSQQLSPRITRWLPCGNQK
jgi:hypothetical protein